MRRLSGSALAVAAVLSLGCGAPRAQTVPPIKPGLWSMHVEQSVNGTRRPDPAAQFANLPPEQRARIEAAMKQNGVDMGPGGGDIKVCLDRASLDAGHWQQRQAQSGNCKTDYATRGADLWQWHTSCTGSTTSESDGEARFQGGENYTVKMNRTSGGAAGARVSQVTVAAKWLGANCGDIRPMNTRP